MKESGSIVRLEIQSSEHIESGLSSSVVFDFDLYELQARIDAIISEARPVYQFEDCVLSTESRQLMLDGNVIHLRPKVYRLLVHLIKNRCRAVSRDELCQVVWDGRCIGNATVDSTIKALRHAVGDDGSAQRLVQTISGFGYRFVAAVNTSVPGAAVLNTSRPLESQLVPVSSNA